jgi:hypothetical protein
LYCTPNTNLKDYMKVEYIEENYQFVKEAEYFEELQVDED